MKTLLIILFTFIQTYNAFAQNPAGNGSSARHNSLSDVMPPPPPPPPLPKNEIVTAKRLAADYSRNRSAAEKKYKKHESRLFVEGIVKDIQDSGKYDLIIILDGSPSAIDVRCETIASRKARKIVKGMKVTFIATCEGLNGNVVLSKCLYIENPTYE